MSEIEWNDEQRMILSRIESGQNVCITGPGGSGKSALIHEIKRRYRSDVQVCAMTGCAAQLLGMHAKTIHSWSGAGIGRKDQIMRASGDRRVIRRWRSIKMLVVDEISMLSSELFEALEELARKCRYDEPINFRDGRRKDHKIFGGLQLLFCGDFYQLAPIDGDFCFQSALWRECFPTMVDLTKIYRQEEPHFMSALMEVRMGNLSKSARKLLSSRICEYEGDEKSVPPTRLFSTRHHVTRINRMELDNLPGEIHSYTQTSSTEPKMPGEELTELKRIRDKTEALIQLKIGCLVMCTSNITDADGVVRLCNGSRGRVVNFMMDERGIMLPLIQFERIGLRLMEPHRFTSDTIKRVWVQQLPLTLAWAITIHKSQGATLESALIDLGEDVFAPGQCYVALSRVKQLSGLYLSAFDPSRIKIDPRLTIWQEMLAEARTVVDVGGVANSDVADSDVADSDVADGDVGAAADESPEVQAPSAVDDGIGGIDDPTIAIMDAANAADTADAADVAKPSSEPITQIHTLRGVTLPEGWEVQDQSLLCRLYRHDKLSPVAAFDFDGTLAKTSLYKSAPEAWSLKYEKIPQMLVELSNQGYHLVCITNESLDRFKRTEAIERAIHKKIYRLEQFMKLCCVNMTVLCSTSNGKYHKPAAGSWQFLESHYRVDRSRSFYVGDSAGRSKDHSACDRDFAINANIAFFTDNKYFK